MSAHLLSLSALHTAAPGVLDVIFGADGDFEGAPDWLPVMWDLDADWWVDAKRDEIVMYGGRLALDCRIPSVAARLLRLCSRASDTAETIDEADDLMGGFSAYMIGMVPWSIEHASRLASLTLSLAPRIAGLRSPA